MYDQVSVVVDGALESEEIFTDYLLESEYIRSVAEDALGDGYETEVYVIEHDHSPDDEECACVQYLTDHHPRYVFPRDAEAFISE